MDTFEQIIRFLSEHWVEICAGASAFLLGAERIAEGLEKLTELTESKKDDRVVRHIYGAIQEFQRAFQFLSMKRHPKRRVRNDEETD